MLISFNGWIVLFFTLILNFTKSSNTYVIDVPNYNDEVITANENPNHSKGINYLNKLHSKNSHEIYLPETITVIQNLLRLFNGNDVIKTKHKCDRHFGSTYGTKMQYLRCIENSNGKKYGRTDLPRFRYPIYYSKQIVKKSRKPKHPLFNYYGKHLKGDLEPFVDLTRQDINTFSNDYFDVGDLARTDLEHKHFSDDYLDVGDLARASYESFTNDDKQRENCIRRNIGNISDLKHKTIAGYLKVRAYSDESESEASEEIKVYKTKQSYKKPNNFEVEDNASSQSDSIEDEPAEKNYKNKNKRDNQYGALQGGNRLYFNSDFDAEARKRLEHFLPKRYHWEEDEIQDLGHFWFNGPRGKYPEPFRKSL